LLIRLLDLPRLLLVLRVDVLGSVVRVALEVIMQRLGGQGGRTAPGVRAESILALIVDDLLDSGIAGHHLLLNLIIPEGEAFEEAGGILQFLQHALDVGRITYSI
jgi:hypothetical protein